MGRPKKNKDVTPDIEATKKVVPKKSPEKETSKARKKRLTKKNLTLDDVLSEVEQEIENQPEDLIEFDSYILTNEQERLIGSIIDERLQVVASTEGADESQVRKTYVVDTSIILNDVTNLFVLSQDNSNTLIIPETVLDEIDNKKKGFNDANFQAREFNRIIDQGKVVNKQITTLNTNVNTYELRTITIELPDGLRLDLVSKDKYEVNVVNELLSIVNDRKILEIAQCFPDSTVVSNDIALRARAISMNLNAQPLMKNRQSDIENISMIELIHITSEEKEFIETREFTPEKFNKKFSNFTNVVFECTDTGEQILTFYKGGKFNILNEKYLRSFPVKPKNKEQLFFMNMLLDKDIPIVVCSGVTGSGKNLLSLAAGLVYTNNQENNRLGSGMKYCRNTVTAGDEVAQLGFLKGDESQKLSVFSYPLIDSIGNYIEIIQNVSRTNRNSIPLITPKQFMEDNHISVLNINQMRGSNVHGYVILDEWQNSSVAVCKLMLTRIVDGSKVIIIGDLNQIDNPHLNKYNNALASMLKLAKTSDLVGGIKLNKVQRGKIAEFAEQNL